MVMSTPLARIYVAASVIAVVCATIVVRRSPSVALAQPRYWRWLLRPWKLATFAIAAAAITLIAPFTNDPNWDYPVSLIMSLLTFTTAPFAVGALWRRRDRASIFVAACAWLLSASWSFDWYWFARRGFYPDSWAMNLIASSCLYLAAGALWNLEWRKGRGTTFAFRDDDWPAIQFGTNDRACR